MYLYYSTPAMLWWVARIHSSMWLPQFSDFSLHCTCTLSSWRSAQVNGCSGPSSLLLCSCWPSTVLLLLVHACMIRIRIRWLASFRSIHRQAESHWPLWKVLMLMWLVLLLRSIHELINHAHVCWISRKIYTASLIFNPPLIFYQRKENLTGKRHTLFVCSVLMFI